MAKSIYCQRCETLTETPNMADLIQVHTDDAGRFLCSRCGTTDTFLQQRDNAARRSAPRWIRGALAIETRAGDPTLRPFVFLTADGPDGRVSGIEFKYYRSNRTADRTARQRARPHGGPVLAPAQLLALAARLARIGVVSADDWRTLTATTAGPRPATP